MSERKYLTITKVEEVKKVGNNQIPKLSFRAKDGDKELSYCTWRSSLFESIKEGETINADVEVKTREWEGETMTERRINQIYVDGQPLGGKKGGQYYRGKSPEELDLSAKSYALAYAKDLAVAERIELSQIIPYAEDFHKWLKGNGAKTEPEKTEPKKKAKPKQDTTTPQLGYINTEWFRESLEQIQANKGESWASDKLLNYLTKSYHVEGETVEQAVANLGKEAAGHFTKKIEEALASIEDMPE